MRRKAPSRLERRLPREPFKRPLRISSPYCESNFRGPLQHGAGPQPLSCSKSWDGLTDTPGSVVPGRCRHGNSGHPSTNAVADALQQPTRTLGRAALKRVLSGLAPGGVYLAFPVTREAGGLLHHRFTLTRPRYRANTAPPRAVCSLWHWPAGYPEWALPTTLPCGARTFLEPLA